MKSKTVWNVAPSPLAIWNALLILISFGTSIILFVGPDSRVLTDIPFLREGVNGLQENSDRLVFLFWLVFPFLFYLTVNRRVNHSPLAKSGIRSESKTSIQIVSLLAGLLTIINLWGFAGDGLVFATAESTALGAVVLVIMAISMMEQHPWVIISRVFLLAVAAYLMLPIILTLITGPSDTFHASYVYEELLSVSAGNIPYSNFYPQYTALFPFILAPFLALSGLSAITALNLLIPLLQLGVYAIITYTCWLYWGRKYGPLLSVIIAIPLLNRFLTDAITSTTYIPNFPIRTLLPLASLAALLFMGKLILSDIQSLKVSLARSTIGFLIAISIFNNPDFGAPVGIAIMFALLLRRSKIVWKLRLLVSLLFGFICAFLGLAILYATTSGYFTPDSFMFFARAFPGTGIDSELMQPFGLHILIASLAIFGVISSVMVLRQKNELSNSPQLVNATLLFGASFWTLLSLAYFANRSLPGTLLVGLGVQTALLIGLIGPQIICTIRDFAQRTIVVTAQFFVVSSLALSPMILLMAYLGSIFIAPPLLPNLNAYSQNQSDTNFPTEKVQDLSLEISGTVEALLAADPSLSVVQAVPFSALVSEVTNIQGLGSVADIDAYLPISSKFSDIFCQRITESSQSTILITNETAEMLEDDGLCSREAYLLEVPSDRLKGIRFLQIDTVQK